MFCPLKEEIAHISDHGPALVSDKSYHFAHPGRQVYIVVNIA